MGFLDAVFKRNSELGFLFDVEVLADTSKRIHMKLLAIEICASFLARTISQSEFRVRDGKKFVKDELYYRLNVRPNKNMTSSTFWHTVVTKQIHDNECLIIQADDGDLLIADSFDHNTYAVYEDTFTNVKVRDFTFARTFKQSEVLHMKYRNEHLSPLIDGLFADYGELFGRIVSSQKRKNQIRGTVDVDARVGQSAESRNQLQEFINKMYKAFSTQDVAIVPQQPGFEYKESNSGSSGAGQSVDEINKVTNGFLDQLAMVIGIPINLLRGDLADVEKQTKNYMMFTVNPFLKKVCDEGNAKFIEKEEFLGGKRIEAKAVSYNSLFDLANSIDKLISSSAFTGNEIRDEIGYDRSDDPNLDRHYITKNYTEMNTTGEGGENE